MLRREAGGFEQLALCSEKDLNLNRSWTGLQDRFALKVSKVYTRNVYREPERQGESCLQFCVKFAITVDNQFKDKLQ
jgi:hypothetical protein